jgi:hypothetical protein
MCNMFHHFTGRRYKDKLEWHKIFYLVQVFMEEYILGILHYSRDKHWYYMLEYNMIIYQRILWMEVGKEHMTERIFHLNGMC